MQPLAPTLARTRSPSRPVLVRPAEPALGPGPVRGNTLIHVNGWNEAAGFTDPGISGATLANRPGVQSLFRKAKRGGFDVVMTEALDRLSRAAWPGGQR
ncbi:recombinase family protein [Brevundimonas vesicularis]|uniref:recombinase family protein n=1 Tax=Brevundimonas vesicularis TaxID=41276 RepID=UPI00161FFCE2